MSLPSNGITADVIRDIMPPYSLSADLLDGTFRALPPPPQDASQAWRYAHITRLTQEIVAFKPGDAAQARIAAAHVIVLELADTITARAYAPGVTIEQMCRVARTTGELLRTANALERTLARHQQKPVPFFGTVMEDEVDIAAVDAIWRGRTSASAGAGATQRTPPGACPGGEDVPDDAAPAARDAADPPEPAANLPDAAPPVADPAPSSTATPTPRPADSTATEAPAQPGGSPDIATRPDRDAGATPAWTVTRLDEGPGWTREVVRRRSGAAACIGAAPGSAAR